MRINLQNIITSIMDKNVLEESFKEKVQAYSLRNPYVMNFVSRYENLIDWKDIKSAKKEGFNVNDSIQNQIKNILDKFIKDKLDPDSKTSIFSSKEDINWDRELQILKTEIANGNPEAQQALDSFKSDPDEAKDSVISSINSGKSAVINDWMQYMRGNKTYSKTMLSNIFYSNLFLTLMVKLEIHQPHLMPLLSQTYMRR